MSRGSSSARSTAASSTATQAARNVCSQTSWKSLLPMNCDVRSTVTLRCCNANAAGTLPGRNKTSGSPASSSGEFSSQGTIRTLTVGRPGSIDQVPGDEPPAGVVALPDIGVAVAFHDVEEAPLID